MDVSAGRPYAVRVLGSFVVIDGPDAAGTTLHARLLAERLEKEGHPVLLTAEPTDGPVGSWIRSILKGQAKLPASALQALFVADRAWHVSNVILPALQEGKTVISDRYTYSTIAYGIALGLDEQWLKDMNKIFVRPDATVFTLPPVEVCLERLARREEKDILEARDLQESIHAAYRKLAEEDPSIIVSDTSGTKESVAQEIWMNLAT